jgi:mono/diheme cytochrome c family protein
MKTLRLLAIPSLALLLGGCAGLTTRSTPVEVFPDMDRQPKYKAQAQSPFFADARASRPPVEGTVAIGQLKTDEAFTTGKTAGFYLGKNPLPVNRDALLRGQEKFNVYCQPCHDRTGSGKGIVPAKVTGWLPTNLHDDRALKMADGEIFEVITNGRRTMKGYRFQVSEQDRWAIVAYVRALQLSQHATMAEVPADRQGALDAGPATTAVAPAEKH